MCVCVQPQAWRGRAGLKPCPPAGLAVQHDSKTKGHEGEGLLGFLPSPLLICFTSSLGTLGESKQVQESWWGHTLPPPRPRSFISRVETQILGIPDTVFYEIEDAPQFPVSLRRVTGCFEWHEKGPVVLQGRKGGTLQVWAPLPRRATWDSSHSGSSSRCLSHDLICHWNRVFLGAAGSLRHHLLPPLAGLLAGLGRRPGWRVAGWLLDGVSNLWSLFGLGLDGGPLLTTGGCLQDTEGLGLWTSRDCPHTGPCLCMPWPTRVQSSINSESNKTWEDCSSERLSDWPETTQWGPGSTWPQTGAIPPCQEGPHAVGRGQGIPGFLKDPWGPLPDTHSQAPPRSRKEKPDLCVHHAELGGQAAYTVGEAQ